MAEAISVLPAKSCAVGGGEEIEVVQAPAYVHLQRVQRRRL